MSETKDRHAWIQRRAESGYDFAPLLEALSQLKVEVTEDGEVSIDATAIEHDPYYPSGLTLQPEGDGIFGHDGSGESGPLPEWLFVVALSVLDRRARAPDSEPEGEGR